MGEKQTKPFQLSFNGFLKVDFQGSRVTSDGGLILIRELGRAARTGQADRGTSQRFTARCEQEVPVRRSAAAVGLLSVGGLPRISTTPFGYPSIRRFGLIGSKKNWDRGAALTSRLQSFETGMLAGDENLIGLMAVNRELVAQAEGCGESERVVLDMDSTESPVHGQQEGSAYNGHFESVCYHPLLLFNQHGDCLAAKLRPGNVSSAEDWDELLLPELERQQAEGKQVTFRADCRFRQAGDLRDVRGARGGLRDPHTGKQEPGVGD